MKEGFIKRNSYLLTAGALFTAGIAVYQNRDIIREDIKNYLNSNVRHRQEQTQTQETQRFPQLDLPQEAAGILKKDKTLVCSFHNGRNDYVLYVSDKHEERRIREIVTWNLRSYHQHTFIEGRIAYRWNNVDKHGYVFALYNGDLEELFENLREVQKPGIKGVFGCRQWKEELESVFELPKDINFTIWPPTQSNSSKQSQFEKKPKRTMLQREGIDRRYDSRSERLRRAYESRNEVLRRAYESRNERLRGNRY